MSADFYILCQLGLKTYCKLTCVIVRSPSPATCVGTNFIYGRKEVEKLLTQVFKYWLNMCFVALLKLADIGRCLFDTGTWNAILA